MQHLAQHIEFIANSDQLSDKEKVMAISNEVREQYTIYPEEEYEDASLYGTELDPEDFTYEWEEWTFWIETLEDRCDTNLDPIYLEEWLDAWLLALVRAIHNNEQVRQMDIDTALDTSDAMSVNTSNRDRRKFFVMNTPGFTTKYHMLPGWGMVSSIVKSNSPYQRKVIRNEEGNFEEVIDNDKPDWLTEMLDNEERKANELKEIKARKMLWKQLREDRVAYKKYYDGYDKLKSINPTEAKSLKAKWDRYYKDYKYYSKLQDKLTELDKQDEVNRKKREANAILKLFVSFQQAAPAYLIEKLPREDVVAYYKSYWYNSTINYLNKCIKRASDLAKKN